MSFHEKSASMSTVANNQNVMRVQEINRLNSIWPGTMVVARFYNHPEEIRNTIVPYEARTDVQWLMLHPYLYSKAMMMKEPVQHVIRLQSKM